MSQTQPESVSTSDRNKMTIPEIKDGFDRLAAQMDEYGLTYGAESCRRLAQQLNLDNMIQAHMKETMPKIAAMIKEKEEELEKRVDQLLTIMKERVLQFNEKELQSMVASCLEKDTSKTEFKLIDRKLPFHYKSVAYKMACQRFNSSTVDYQLGNISLNFQASYNWSQYGSSGYWDVVGELSW